MADGSVKFEIGFRGGGTVAGEASGEDWARVEAALAAGEGTVEHRARRAPHLAARRRRRLRRARRAAPPGRGLQRVARVSAARRQRVLDRVVIGYSALGNRGLLWVGGGVVVGARDAALPGDPAGRGGGLGTLGLNYADQARRAP